MPFGSPLFSLPNAKHCKDITWDVQIAPVVTGVVELVFDEAAGTDYFVWGGALFWKTAPGAPSVVKAQAMLDGEPVGRALTITFP